MRNPHPSPSFPQPFPPEPSPPHSQLNNFITVIIFCPFSILSSTENNLQLVGEHNLNANDGERAVRVKLRFDIFQVITKLRFDMFCDHKNMICVKLEGSDCLSVMPKELLTELIICYFLIIVIISHFSMRSLRSGMFD